MIQLDTSYTVSAFLLLVTARQDRNIPCSLYWEDRDDDPLLTDTFLVAAPVEVQDDAMIFPASV